MLKLISFIFFMILSFQNSAQQKLDKLTVEKIMRDPKWMGTSPSGTQWSFDGNYLYFNWNPDKNESDSLYYITRDNKTPVKATVAQKQNIMSENGVNWNLARTAYVYSRDGDVFFTDTKTNKTKRITHTTDAETNPQFSFNETKIVYTRSQNLFAWDILSGETMQLTNLQRGAADPQRTGGSNFSGGNFGSGGGGNQQNRPARDTTTQQEQWLKNDQLLYFQVLKERKDKRDKTDAYNKSLPKAKELRTINISDKGLQGVNLSPDGRFVGYRLTTQPANAKTTIVPSYVTETGFTTDIAGRTKVGAPLGTSEFYIYDREKDTVYAIRTDSVPGIKDLPDYVKDYPTQLERRNRNPVNRPVTFAGPSWSPKGTYAVLDIRSQDNKDRWIMLWSQETNKLKLLDRQHDDAWIGGPGIGFFGNTGWIDDNTFYFQSEATGYSHLYTINPATGEKKAFFLSSFFTTYQFIF